MSLVSAVPDGPPANLVQGDSAGWAVSFPGYEAADGWVLHYAFAGPAFLSVAADPLTGSIFGLTLTRTASATLKPGAYTWTAYATRQASDERRTLNRGVLTVEPDPAAALAKSHAAHMVEMIQAALEGRTPDGIESCTIDGQMISKIPLLQLLTFKAHYEAEVRAEVRTARQAAGKKSGNKILLRFR